MIGAIIAQGVKLGAVFTVAETAAPVIKRGVHQVAQCVADATRADKDKDAAQATTADSAMDAEKVVDAEKA